MTIYQLKSNFQNLFRPLVKGLAARGVTANQVTLTAFLFSIGIGLYFLVSAPSRGAFFIIPAFLFVRMALNAIDGMLAREHNMKSSLGAILNELTDVLSDAVIYYPLGVLWGVSAHINCLFIVLAAMTEMVGVVSVQIGANRRYDGPLGKSDRAFVFGLCALLYALNVQISNSIFWLYSALALLSAITICNRARQALNEAKP